MMKRFISWLLCIPVLVCLASCGSDNDDPKPDTPKVKTVTLNVTPQTITYDGENATFTVLADGVDVTDKAKIYASSGAAVSGSTFSSSEAGTFTFYAEYATKRSNDVTVTVVDNGPKLAADPQPKSTAFKQRLLLMQHTGTKCGYCPIMIMALRTLADDAAYADRYTLAAIHSYSGDPMRTALITQLSDAYRVEGWPYLSMDFKKIGTGAMSTWTATCSKIAAAMDGEYSSYKPAGIASAARIVGDELEVKLQVKANEDGKYRVGAWLLEDGINLPQTNYQPEVTGDAEFNIHNNVVRNVSGRQAPNDFSGDDLGEIKAGETATKVVKIDLSSGWKRDNLKLLIFVSRLDKADNAYVAVNSQYAPVDGTAAFDYEK